jgi:hypothetical protein
VVSLPDIAVYCKFCATRAKSPRVCPQCLNTFCSTCYWPHHKAEHLVPPGDAKSNEGEKAVGPSLSFVTDPSIKQKTIDKMLEARDAAARLRETIPRLDDTEGTQTPASANPFIFKRGTGRPDEPPEAAGAPNRGKKVDSPPPPSDALVIA